MTYEFNLIYAGWTLLGLVVGLALGRLTWGRAAHRHRRVADSVANAAATAAAQTQAAAAQRELAAAQAAMRPLADEIDRLKRDLAKARRPVQAPLPLGTGEGVPTAAAPHVAPTEAVAGTGPIVVGETAAGGLARGSDGGVPTADDGPIIVGGGAVIPDIRQLKGVGDRFAAALEGLGLGSVDAIARLTADEALDADTRLGTFNGRIAKDRLVEQAVLLDEGRATEYAARFGKLG